MSMAPRLRAAAHASERRKSTRHCVFELSVDEVVD